MNCFMELLIGSEVSSSCSEASLVEVMSRDLPYEAGFHTQVWGKSPEQADSLAKWKKTSLYSPSLT